MLILNTGGTLNKRYNLLNGELDIPVDNYAIDTILASSNHKYNLAGLIYKDSLEMNNDDRITIANIIMQSDDDTFILVHGTDTMSTTAEFLSEIFEDRKIILVGAMKPFEVDKIEASLNIGMAIGFSKGINNFGVYICMSGYIELWDIVKKNTDKGMFEIV